MLVLATEENDGPGMMLAGKEVKMNRPTDSSVFGENVRVDLNLCPVAIHILRGGSTLPWYRPSAAVVFGWRTWR